MTILASKVENKKGKFDTKVASNTLAIMTGDYIEAMILQQLHYWIEQGYGVVIKKMRWIYKSIKEFIADAFPILTPWTINKALVSLVEKGFLFREHLFAEHHGHNFHIKNRTYYYTLNYEKIWEELEKYESAETTEKSRFVSYQKTVSRNTKKQVSDCPKNKTKNTSKENDQRKEPHPSLPHIEKKSGGGNPSTSSSPIQKKSPSQKKNSSDELELSKVLARPKKIDVAPKAIAVETNPACVEQKVNQNRSTKIETGQKLDVQESVQAKTKSKRKKTPKGTKPKKTYLKALWSTEEEREQFRKALTLALVNGVGNARNITALVSYVINQITQGHSHTYWEEWSDGEPIGSSEKLEWEAAPSKPYPKFQEYLVEKLIYPHETRSQALFRVGKILNDKTQAGIYWRDFKRVIEGLRQDAEKAHREGKQVALPVWFIERAEISLERAGDSAQKMAQLAPNQRDWIETKLPESEKLLTAPANLSLPGVEEQEEQEEQELTVTPDPWADDGDFCFNGFIDLSYLEQQARKLAASPGKIGLFLVDFRSALSQATKNQRETIRRAISPIYPELLDFL